MSIRIIIPGMSHLNHHWHMRSHYQDRSTGTLMSHILGTEISYWTKTGLILCDQLLRTTMHSKSSLLYICLIRNSITCQACCKTGILPYVLTMTATLNIPSSCEFPTPRNLHKNRWTRLSIFGTPVSQIGRNSEISLPQNLNRKHASTELHENNVDTNSALMPPKNQHKH